jgi:hypothetical protein
MGLLLFRAWPRAAPLPPRVTDAEYSGASACAVMGPLDDCLQQSGSDHPLVFCYLGKTIDASRGGYCPHGPLPAAQNRAQNTIIGAVYIYSKAPRVTDAEYSGASACTVMGPLDDCLQQSGSGHPLVFCYLGKTIDASRGGYCPHGPLPAAQNRAQNTIIGAVYSAKNPYSIIHF